MPRQSPRSLRFPAIVALLACGAAISVATGCEERVENPPVQGAAAQQPQSQTVVEGGGAGLGKARDSATGIEQKVDEYNRKLEEQIDKVNEK